MIQYLAMVKTKSKDSKAKKASKTSLKKTTQKGKNFPRFSRKTTIAIVIGLFLLGFFYFKRHWLVVAVVNGQPIWRWQYNQTLEEQYGTQVLDQIIDKRLIEQKAKEEGVVVDQEVIDQEIDQIKESLGPDNSLEEILTFQGMTMAGLREEIKNQLILEELLSSGVEVSQEEIDQYLVDNEETIMAEGEKERTDEATEAIRMDKMNQKFQDWYQTLREEAKITYLIGQQAQSLED
ncbi:MAG: SurA N-terminal domain-containing protein [Patescibacteria group bacterium]|jgi:hypothetical protein